MELSQAKKQIPWLLTTQQPQRYLNEILKQQCNLTTSTQSVFARKKQSIMTLNIRLCTGGKYAAWSIFAPNVNEIYRYLLLITTWPVFIWVCICDITSYMVIRISYSIVEFIIWYYLITIRPKSWMLFFCERIDNQIIMFHTCILPITKLSYKKVLWIKQRVAKWISDTTHLGYIKMMSFLCSVLRGLMIWRQH